MIKNRLTNKKLGIALSLSLILILIEGFFLYQFSKEKNNKIYEVNLVKINNQKDSLDYFKLKNDLISMDESIDEINQFLMNKNIHIERISRLSKDSLSNSVYLSKRNNRYAKYLVLLEQKLQEVPLGVPVEGYVSSSFGERTNPIPPKIAEETQIIENNNNNNDTLANMPKNKKPVIPKQFHKGLDLAAEFGSDVKCTAEGKVIFSGQKGGYGNCVIVEHKNGLATLYGHLSQLFVKANQWVKVNDIIAKSGNSGRSTGPHLHYEVHKNNTPINPKLFLNL